MTARAIMRVILHWRTRFGNHERIRKYADVLADRRRTDIEGLDALTPSLRPCRGLRSPP